MAHLRRFPVVRYNPDVVSDLGRVLAPPYDVLADGDYQLLTDQHQHNSVQIDAAPGGGDEARETFEQWVADDVLEEGAVGVVVVQQRFVGPDGVRRTRVGVLCELELEPFADGSVHPHERTFDAPRIERRELLEAAGINTSPVFVLAHDSKRSLTDLFASTTDDEPDVTGLDPDGTQTAAWFVEDLTVLDRFEQLLDGAELLIADGHHRYTAALEARARAQANAPSMQLVGGRDHSGPPVTASSGSAGVLAFVANSMDRGIAVFPTHRLISGADLQSFDDFATESGVIAVSEVDDVETGIHRLESSAVPGFVLCTAERTRLVTVPEASDMQLAAPNTSDAYRSLDVAALHALVIDGGAMLAADGATVTYTRSLEEAVARVRMGEADAAFLLREADVGTIHDVASAGELLPQKSTYFFPKVPAGIAFRRAAP